MVLRSCTHTGFLSESDSDVEFFTRTGITAAGGQFYFEERRLYIETPCRFQTEVFKTVVRHRQVQTRVQVPVQLH